MKRVKKLSRAERVRLASSRFKLPPQAVESALDWIADGLQKRDRRSNLVGDKASRKQVRMLRDTARKAMNIVKGNKLPPMLGALFAASDTLGMLQTMRDRCDIVLTNKLTPKRDDADGFEKVLDIFRAKLLPLGRRPADWMELAAILYGTGNAAAMRNSYTRYLMEEADIKAAHYLSTIEEMIQDGSLSAEEKQHLVDLLRLPPKQCITELEEQLQAEEKKPGRK